MTTAQRPAGALVDRRRCEGPSLSGSPSGLAGIATLLNSSFRHSRPGADFDVRGTLHVRQSTGGKARHVALTDDGIALFEQLTGWPRRRRADLYAAGWQAVGKIAAAEAVACGVRGREHHSDGFLPHPPRRLRETPGHGRRPAPGRSVQLPTTF